MASLLINTTTNSAKATEYSLDGVTYQANKRFDNLPDGQYQAYARLMGTTTVATKSVIVGTAPPANLEDVVWIDLSGAAPNGNTLTVSYNGFAHSSRVLGPSADAVRGYLEFKIGSNTEYVIGLSNVASQGNYYGDIPIGIHYSGGNFREFGSLVPEVSFRNGASINDVFRIQIEIGKATFWRNNSTFATVALTVPAQNLQVDLVVLNGETIIADAKLQGANLLTA